MFSYFSQNNNLSHVDMPHIESISSCDTYGVLVDSASLLWHKDAETKQEALTLNLEELKVLKSCILLWNTDLTLLRLKKRSIDKLLKQCTIIASNEYIRSLLQVFYPPPIYILRMPIIDIPYGKKKDNLIVASGTVGFVNGTDVTIELFKSLPKDIHKVYIGHSNLLEDTYLEGQLKNECDWYPDVADKMFADIMARSKYYIHTDKTDVNASFFIKFALSGSYIFAPKKLTLFDEYDYVKRFNSVDHCVDLIAESNVGNKHIVDKDKYSVDVFHKNLQKIIWR